MKVKGNLYKRKEQSKYSNYSGMRIFTENKSKTQKTIAWKRMWNMSNSLEKGKNNMNN